MAEFTEPELLEKAALEWFKELGYEAAYGPDISPGGPRPERESYSDVLLLRRLRASLTRINPTLPSEAIDKLFMSSFISQSRHLRRRIGSSTSCSEMA
jgi:Type I restriction enzyme R protein N terminus (HSDR_N).